MVLEPNRGLKTSKSLLRCKDGHYVNSRLEGAVDDFLYSHGVLNEVYQRIPYSHFKADFKVADVFIEVWGLKGRRDYDEEKGRKIQHYNKYNIKMIVVEPGQNIANKLAELIRGRKKIVELDVYDKASKDPRIEDIDREINELESKIMELIHRRNQIIDENVKALTRSPN